MKRKLFDSDHEQFRTSVRKFLAEEAAPHREAWEKNGQVSREIWQRAGELGMLCPTIPEEYGGVGVDFRYNTIVDEEVARCGVSGLGFGLHSDISVPYLLAYGTEAQKAKYLPGCIDGSIITAIAMTEPGTGSDLQSVKTFARRDGDEFVINGSKTFITNGQMADLVFVVAKSGDGEGAKAVSLFLVEAGTTGFTKGKNLEKIGLKSQDTSELFFQDVRIPATNLLGEEGKGFIYLMQELSQERLSVGVAAVAVSEWILEETVNYVKERQAFGRPIAAFQNTQFKLAELSAEVTQSRIFVDYCLAQHLSGELDQVLAAKLKLLTTDLQC